MNADLPIGLSMPDSSKIIVEVEQRIFENRDITNRKLPPKKCPVCYCNIPREQATCEHCKNIAKNKRKEILHTIGCMLAGFAIIALASGGVMKLLEWLF